VPLAQQYVKAEKEEDKTKLRGDLTKLLRKQFDQHLEQQKKELEALEKQIEHLRSVLDKRRENRDKIIERRFEQLVQDAEGLGWNSPNAPAAAFYPYAPALPGPVPVISGPVHVTPPKTKAPRKREKHEDEDKDNGARP
jgi:hypothetical protein